MSCDCKVLLAVAGGIFLVAVVIVVALVVTSMEKLESDEVGLKYDTFNKILSSEPFFEGLHTGAPGFEFITFPSVFKTLSFDGLQCLNIDGVPITLYISYQYRVRAKKLREVVMQFKDHEGYRRILGSIGRGALRDVCSQFNTSQFQSERGIFQEEIRKRLLTKYDNVHCDVTDLQVNNINRPSAYEGGIRAKESAREDIEVAERERPRQLTEALTDKREAETQAAITVNKAESDSRILLTRAQTEADGILNAYQQEASTYKAIVSSDGLKFDTAGFLAYMGVRTLEDAEQDVYVNMKSPIDFLGTA